LLFESPQKAQMMLTKKLKVFLALVLAGVAAVCQADPVPQIDDMVSAAMNGNEAKVLELKSRIELLPKPARGDRKRARSLNEQGLKELNAGNFAEAATVFEQAGSADPLDAEILSNEGYALIKADDPEAAIDPIERSIALQPGRASAWGTLGEALARSGFLEQATAAFNIAFTFSQNREKTKEFLAKLSADDTSPVLVKATKAALAAEGIKAPAADASPSRVAGGIPAKEQGSVNNANLAGAASPTTENQPTTLSSDGQPQQSVPSPAATTPDLQATPAPKAATQSETPKKAASPADKPSPSDNGAKHEPVNENLHKLAAICMTAMIAALIALIKPSIVNIFRIKQPARLKVFGAWLGILLIFGALIPLLEQALGKVATSAVLSLVQLAICGALVVCWIKLWNRNDPKENAGEPGQKLTWANEMAASEAAIIRFFGMEALSQEQKTFRLKFVPVCALLVIIAIAENSRNSFNYLLLLCLLGLVTALIKPAVANVFCIANPNREKIAGAWFLALFMSIMAVNIAQNPGTSAPGKTAPATLEGTWTCEGFTVVNDNWNSRQHVANQNMAFAANDDYLIDGNVVGRYEFKSGKIRISVGSIETAGKATFPDSGSTLNLDISTVKSKSGRKVQRNYKCQRVAQETSSLPGPTQQAPELSLKNRALRDLAEISQEIGAAANSGNPFCASTARDAALRVQELAQTLGAARKMESMGAPTDLQYGAVSQHAEAIREMLHMAGCS
jgi:Tfp pilus assembly protein PilF